MALVLSHDLNHEVRMRRPHKEISGQHEIKKEIKPNPAKEESMANKEQTATDNPMWNYAGQTAGQAQEAFKDLYNYQLKTTQTWFDQMVKWGQTYTDHMYTQANEASRLSQEFLKSGTHFADEIRKNYYQMTEKMTK